MRINLRESLGKLDLETANKYDLRNHYDSSKISDLTKNRLAEAIDKKASAEKINRILNENFAINVFSRDSEEYEKLEKVADYLTNYSPNNIYYRVEKTYFDFGQNWMWTTIIAYDKKGNSWQAIYPKVQEDILLSDSDEELEEIAKKILRESRLDKGFTEAYEPEDDRTEEEVYQDWLDTGAIPNYDEEPPFESLKEDLDLSEVEEIKELPFDNKRVNNLRGIFSAKDLVDALNKTGLDKLKIRTSRLKNVSQGDIKDAWMDLKRKGWSVSIERDDSLKGFNEVYVFEKITNESLTESTHADFFDVLDRMPSYVYNDNNVQGDAFTGFYFNSEESANKFANYLEARGFTVDQSEENNSYYKGYPFKVSVYDDIAGYYFDDDNYEYNESLTEASYGGAYDIEDDMYFTKEELVEFADEFIEKFSDWSEHRCDLEDLYMDSPKHLVVDVYDNDDGVTHRAEIDIDMRKIRTPKSIYKYGDSLLKQWKDSYLEYHEYDESLTEEIEEEQLYKIVCKNGPSEWPFESALSYEDAEELVDYYNGRWIDEKGFEWSMEIEEDDESTERVFPFAEALKEKLSPAPQEVVDELLEILNKYNFVLDDSLSHPIGKTWSGNTHIQVINKDSHIEETEEPDTYAEKLMEYVPDEMENEIDALSEREKVRITYNFGINRDWQVTGGLDVWEKHVPGKQDESLDEDVLEYDDEISDTWADLFDIASPQEVADNFGKNVKSKDKVYKPTKEELQEDTGDYYRNTKEGKDYPIPECLKEGFEDYLYRHGVQPEDIQDDQDYDVYWNKFYNDLELEREKEENLKESIDISDYEELHYPLRDGDKYYQLYRKIENGKGVWAAAELDKYGSDVVGEPFKITYEQARGFEPIEDSSIRKLSRDLGKKLLPKRENLEEQINLPGYAVRYITGYAGNGVNNSETEWFRTEEERDRRVKELKDKNYIGIKTWKMDNFYHTLPKEESLNEGIEDLDSISSIKAKDMTDDDFKVLKPLVDEYLKERKALGTWPDSVDERNFVKKWYKLADKCKEIAKNGMQGITGYGRLNDFIKIKILELARSVDNTFFWYIRNQLEKFGELTELLKEAIEDEVDFDEEEYSDFDDDTVEEGTNFIEDGTEWVWVERIAGPIHLDFDNWAVWAAREYVDPRDFMTMHDNGKGYDFDGDGFKKKAMAAPVNYFVVDEDTGFIDWGPVETQTEAQDFLNGKVEDWEEEVGSKHPSHNDLFGESLKESKELNEGYLELYYDDIDGNGESYTYDLSEDEVLEYLKDYTSDCPDDIANLPYDEFQEWFKTKEYDEWLEDNLYDLFYEHEEDLLDHFERKAQEEYFDRYGDLYRQDRDTGAWY